MINIFEVNSEDVRKPADDFIGTMRSGMQLNGRPMSLPTWRFTSPERGVMETVANSYGGEVEEWETQSPEGLQVITEVDKLDVILVGIKANMVLWGRNGKIRECDGIVQKADDSGNCADCACPSTLPERKAAAKQGTGCEPSVGLFFRLDTPNLVNEGIFRFYSSAWGFAKDINDVEARFGKVDGDAHATIVKELVEFTNAAGESISYMKPVVTIGEAVVDETGAF